MQVMRLFLLIYIVLQIVLDLVLYVDGFTNLNLDELELSVSIDGVLAAYRHSDHIAGSNLGLNAVHNSLALSGDYGPYLISVLMAVIVHGMSCIKGYLDGKRLVLNIDNLEITPGLLSKHDLLLEGVNKRLDIGALLLV